MNLSKKKELAQRTFNVGKNRIVFLESRINEIKEAITKQDMRDLKEQGAIIIKQITGRRRKTKRRKSRSTGNIRKKSRRRKEEYVALTRKLRKYLSQIKKEKSLSREEVADIRNKIRNKMFRSKSHLKEYLEGKK